MNPPAFNNRSTWAKNGIDVLYFKSTFECFRNLFSSQTHRSTSRFE